MPINPEWVNQGWNVLQQLYQALSLYGPRVYVEVTQFAQGFYQFVQTYGPWGPAIQERISQFAQEASRRLGNADQGGSSSFFQPGGGNKWSDAGKFAQHVTKHLVDRPQEKWEELFGMSRQDMLRALSDPSQRASIEKMYDTYGAIARTQGMRLGTQTNGSSVFLDLNTRVVTFVTNGGNGVTYSIYRVVSVDEFFTSLQRFNTMLPPGLDWQTVRQLLLAAGAGQ